MASGHAIYGRKRAGAPHRSHSSSSNSTAMKISPKKPHFFKPLLPGFPNGLKLPIFFFKYILTTDEKSYGKALLKNKGIEWAVSVRNGCFVGNGWASFAEENNLKPCDFVVFKHHGNMVFDVVVLDGITQCKKKQHASGDGGAPLNKSRFEAPSSKAAEEGIPSDHEEEEEQGRPYFIATIKHSNTLYGWLSMTREFARSTGLNDRNGEIIVKDEQEKSWCFDLRTNDSHVRIKRGSQLAEFFTANGFKEGDSYKLEVLKVAENREEMPVVRILPAQSIACPDHSYTATIKSYSVGRKNQCLHVPLKFAQQNGLCEKRAMVLGDKEGRAWQVNLRSTPSRLSIYGGWKNFVDGNGIKVGDAFKFEIVENGAVPVVRFIVNDA